ncbi:MAG TPA: LytTR family DNA-binding domain-containing protein [Gemmatimonadaceae bacterium]|nr:LytTR family DNA-binding domain-containing protein [Gemmatimonadaceae bacterium]
MDRALGVAIVDDEPLARRGVRRLVSSQAGFRVVGEAETGSEARELIERARPDVVLLDVQMPDGSGLDAIRRVAPQDRPITIFVSAYDDYAVDAFGVRAVDYVLKPFTDARLIESLGRAREAHTARDLARDAAARDSAGATTFATQIVVRSVGRNDVVPVADIHWIEAVGYYARLHSARGTLLHRESLDSLAARLDPVAFARVHRSSIVRVDAIRRTRRLRSGTHELTLASGQRVVVSRSGWSSLRGRVADAIAR